MVSASARPGTHSGSRGELADLLRSRRDRLTPADVGLPAGTRRRTAGLRREEVAQLAGVSTTYYTFLEQGRDVRPSRQVVTALASALRLSSAERAHLFQLAGISVAAEDEAQAETRVGLTLDPTFTIQRFRAGQESDNRFSWQGRSESSKACARPGGSRPSASTC